MDSQISECAFPTREDAIEAKAFMDLNRLAPQNLRDREQFECLPINSGCAISLPNAPAIGLNRVLGLGSVGDLDTAYNWMHRKAGNRFLLVNFCTASHEVRRWIQTKNLHEHGPGWAKLTLKAPLSGAQSPNIFTTRRVRVDEAKIFGSMMCKGFNFPPTLVSLSSAIVGKEGRSCFFALDGETPIGTGAIYASGKYAWLGGVVRHFLTSEIVGSRKRSSTAASTMGLHAAYRRSSWKQKFPPISYDNLRKTGFGHVYDRKNVGFHAELSRLGR